MDSETTVNKIEELIKILMIIDEILIEEGNKLLESDNDSLLKLQKFKLGLLNDVDDLFKKKPEYEAGKDLSDEAEVKLENAIDESEKFLKGLSDLKEILENLKVLLAVLAALIPLL